MGSSTGIPWYKAEGWRLNHDNKYIWVKFAGLIKEAFIISCIIVDNQEWKYNDRQQAESITCKTATPTATPATGTKLASTHSSPARRHPRSKMLRSPGWEDKISLSTNYNQPPSQHAVRELACTTYQQERYPNRTFFIKTIQTLYKHITLLLR